MNIHVELYALARHHAVLESGEGLEFGAGARGSSAVIFGARVGRGAAGHGPVRVPVAVYVRADAGAARAGHSVLAPEARRCLRENEACGVSAE